MRLSTFLLLAISLVINKDANSQFRRLVWRDEFNGDRLNDRYWIYEEHCGRFNKELQCYTKHRPENVRVENGLLIIEARPEPYNGYDFTSGRLLTRKSWVYGRYEIRARMPKGRHLWPAIWMLAKHQTYGGWPTNGEIDIAEVIGNTADAWSSTIHYGPTEENLHSIGSGLRNFSIDLSEDFHTYTLDWNKNRIIWFLDHRPYFGVNIDRMMCCKKKSPNEIAPKSPYRKKGQPFDRPFYMILNVAVGGTFFGPPPYVTPEEARNEWTKNTMEVDYIRIYQ